MSKITFGWMAAVFFFIGSFSLCSEAFAADSRYPQKDIVVVVPFAPGGGCDVIARAAAPFLQKYLPRKVNLVIQNISAASGRVGSFQVYDAKPDGYTIGVLDPLVFVIADVMGELGKRDMKRITWIQRASSMPYALAVSPQSPIQSLSDFKGKKVTAAVSQSGVAGNIVVLRYLGAEPQLVMYSGGAETCLAAMRGDTDVVINVIGTVLRQAAGSGGKLVVKALFSENRLSLAPDLPTAKELGYPVSKDILALLSFDYVFSAPPGLPADLYKILNEAIEKTLRDPSFIDQLNKAKITVDPLPTQEMQKRIEGVVAIVPQYRKALQETLSK